MELQWSEKGPNGLEIQKHRFAHVDHGVAILIFCNHVTHLGRYMSKLMLVLFVMLLPLTCMAEEMDMDGCLYDKNVFPQMLEELRKQYAHSKYMQNKESLEVYLQDGTVRVAYGGCEHYGTEITYAAIEKKAYSTREAFDKAADLVERFGQNRVDAKALQKLFSLRKYEEIGPGVFSIPYPRMDEFTIEIGKKSGRLTITISFYN
jgi:hypothetical protein